MERIIYRDDEGRLRDELTILENAAAHLQAQDHLPGDGLAIYLLDSFACALESEWWGNPERAEESRRDALKQVAFAARRAAAEAARIS